MILDAWMHFFIMLGLVAYSGIKKTDRRFIFILCIYAAAWQVSDYMSQQEGFSTFFKIFFQSAVSIAIIDSIVFLKYTRFTSLFAGLLLIGISALFTIFVLDEFATNSAYNYGIELFGLINIQLIYLELLALTGITFDMGSGRRIYRKSFESDLHRATSPFGIMGRI